MIEALHRFWLEPKVQDPPDQSWRDWLLALGLVTIGLATVVMDEGVWEKGANSLVIGATLLVPWRRAFPLATVVIASSIYATLHASMVVLGIDGRLVGTWSMVVLLYALARWASGRHTFFGLSVATLAVLIGRSVLRYDTMDLFIGSLVFWIAPVLVGITVRTQAHLGAQRVRDVRLKERHALARELHDTVAHHVSAITIQAQAGRAAAAKDPTAAIRSLAVIEESSSRTLNEMRKMVGALRDSESAELAPQRGVRDIERIAGATVGGPSVEVELSGDLEDLGPSVEAGLFRLALEAITNARKHARRAKKIAVRIAGSASGVRLTVADDGEPAVVATGRGGRPGYGLVGMAERTKLLGGTFQAGPGPYGGWVIEAALPRTKAGGGS